MNPSHVPHDELLWVFDNDPSCVSMYQQTLGLQYKLRMVKSISDLIHELSQVSDQQPCLLIADPENADGDLTELFKKGNVADGPLRKTPETIIVSKNDNLELMRFFMKTGVRDYLLKPIRPNELIAKVERALHRLSNREVLILRNDLDGIQVSDLTFREHQMLTIFISKPHRAVTREELYGAIWSKITVNKKTLDVHLFNLRRKIRPLGYDIIYQNQQFRLCKTSQVAN